MKKLTALLVLTLFVVNYIIPFDTTTNLYLNPISFLGFVVTSWFLLGTYKLAQKLKQQINN
jgi:hypothetical protein